MPKLLTSHPFSHKELPQFPVQCGGSFNQNSVLYTSIS